MTSNAHPKPPAFPQTTEQRALHARRLAIREGQRQEYLAGLRAECAAADRRLKKERELEAWYSA